MIPCSCDLAASVACRVPPHFSSLWFSQLGSTFRSYCLFTFYRFRHFDQNDVGLPLDIDKSFGWLQVWEIRIEWIMILVVKRHVRYVENALLVVTAETMDQLLKTSIKVHPVWCHNVVVVFTLNYQRIEYHKMYYSCLTLSKYWNINCK